MTQTLWIVRAAIDPLNWAFVCDKSKTGNCLPTGFTYEENDAKKFRTYEGAVRAEMKLRKAKGYTHNQTETSAAKVDPVEQAEKFDDAGYKEHSMPEKRTNPLAMELKLIDFARRTLEIMEQNQHWNSDTSEAICNAALAVGVAGFKHGFFKGIKS